jgi:hypothetical protein
MSSSASCYSPSLALAKPNARRYVHQVELLCMIYFIVLLEMVGLSIFLALCAAVVRLLFVITHNFIFLLFSSSYVLRFNLLMEISRIFLDILCLI